MKRFLLIVALLLFSNVARAEMVNPSTMTVSEFYSLYNNAVYNNTNSFSTQEWYNYFSMTGYLMGIRDITSVKYDANNNKETYDCINRPLNVWIPLVFDAYKLNRIKGDELFYIYFFLKIEEVCKVDLFGINKEPQIRVGEVIDGDTVKIIKNGEEITVRLADIDCFETSKNSRAKWQSEYYKKSIDEVIRLGKFSKSMLHSAVIGEPIMTGKKVMLIDKGKDKYNRTLGYLFIDGVDINDYMLRIGKCEKYVPRKN